MEQAGGDNPRRNPTARPTFPGATAAEHLSGASRSFVVSLNPHSHL